MSVPSSTQSFKNHTRWVPGFHFVAGTLTLVVLVWMLYRLLTQRTWDSALGAIIGFALTLQYFYIRQFPMAVQDRVIRLEERVRLARLLSADLQASSDALTAEQLIGLRFASDAELPALVKRVLNERIADRGAIKALVTTWRADSMRA